MKSIKLFKALADRSRLLIINALMEKPLYVELLAERLQLSASTISFHLKKLEDVGFVYSEKEQYYVIYHLRKELLDKTLKELINVEDIEKKVQEARVEQYRKKVLDAFLEYGKLKAIPVQRKKRRIILEEIAKKFEKGRVYSEKEVNLIITEFHDDFCTIRREMVGEKIFQRENGIYQLCEND
ncbi:MAG: metalloregulator ArsR/SmtB family transcription factor [Halanaerobiales bacterium]|nr:metalloregulator ArsR/SmtB family transcription factor [Halanaerobiales bacterium]